MEECKPLPWMKLALRPAVRRDSLLQDLTQLPNIHLGWELCSVSLSSYRPLKQPTA